MSASRDNLLWMMLHAWNAEGIGGHLVVNSTEPTSLVDLFASIMDHEVTALVRRGLDRAYRPTQDWLAMPRGRIRFEELVGCGLRTAALPCDCDEFDHDVPHNRILKATMSALLRAVDLDLSLRKPLTDLVRMLDDVAHVPLSHAAFRRVQMHRGKGSYHFLMKVCHLIWLHGMPKQGSAHGRFGFYDFTGDERVMGKLFERAVHGFLRRSRREFRHEWKVGRLQSRWDLKPRDARSAELLPRMQTDITLDQPGLRLIIECKYPARVLKRGPAGEGPGNEKLSAKHLYQLRSYMLDDGSSDGKRVCGMLLYPQVEAPVRADYSIRESDRQLCVRSIDLKQHWKVVEHSLLLLIDECAGEGSVARP